MKKINLFHTCFSILFLCLWAYLDIYLKLQSVYWLIGKCICFFLICAVAFFIRLRQKNESIWSSVFALLMWFSLLGWYEYQEITKYNRNVCQDKFGREFNKTRRSLGVPEIPADWIMEDRDRFSVVWQRKAHTIGHQSKYISIETCVLKYEDDSYNLKPFDTIKRRVTINTQYARGKSKDSLFYHYEVGDSTRSISKKQADSIFDAEKIKKDY